MVSDRSPVPTQIVTSTRPPCWESVTKWAPCNELSTGAAPGVPASEVPSTARWPGTPGGHIFARPARWGCVDAALEAAAHVRPLRADPSPRDRRPRVRGVARCARVAGRIADVADRRADRHRGA